MRSILQALFVLLLIVICNERNIAQNVGDYRAAANGSFEDNSIWQIYNLENNWVPASVTPNSSTYITIGSSFSVIVNTNFTCGKLLLNGTITIISGVTFSSTGMSIISPGAINGPGTFSVSAGSLEMKGGTISANGNLTVQPGGNLILDGNGSLITGSITNNGTTTWSTNGNGTGTFINNGTFIANNGGSFSPNFINNGTVNYTGNSYCTFATFSNVSPGIVNISANSVMTIRGNSSPITESGTFNVASGGMLSVENGYTTSAIYNFTGSITGAGTVRFSCTTANISGTYNITGITRISSGTTIFHSTTVLTSIGTILADGGALNLSSGLTLNGLGNLVTIGYYAIINFNTGNELSINSLTISSGEIAGSDNVTVTNTFNSQGSTISGSGTLTLDAGCTMAISSNPINVNGAFINNGTIDWTSQSFQGTGSIINNGTINISGANKSCSVNFINSSTGIINNSGTTEFSGIHSVGCYLSNLGTINITGGILSLAPYSGSSTLDGTINCSQGTTLRLGQSGGGSLIVNSTINSEGIVSMASIINLHGIYNNTGTTATTNGTTNFNNDMNLVSLGNLNPTGGTTYFKNGLNINGIGSSIIINGGTVDFSTGYNLALQDLTLGDYGTLQGFDNITISGSFISSGYFRGQGTRTILAGATGIIGGNGWVQNTTLYNYGTLTWQDYDIKSDGTIDNRNIFNITSNNTSTSYVTILNNGTINRTTNSSSITFQGPLVNNGTLNVDAGTVYFNNASTSAGNINLNSSETLFGTLALTSNFSPAGTISIASGCSIIGNYQLNFNGTSLINNGTISATTLQFGTSSALSGTGAISSNVIVSNTGNLNLGSNHQLKSITINSGGIFNIHSCTAKFNGNGLPITNNGTSSISNGTIEYNGTSPQTVANLPYQNISINNSAGVTLNFALTLGGMLNLKLGTFTNGSYLTMANGATISRANGTLASAPNFGTTINLFYSQTGSPTTPALELPASSSVLNNLTVMNSGGLLLGGNITVNGTVTLQSGNITTGSDYILTLAPSASLAGEGSGRYVIGKLITTRNVGTSNSDFGGIGVSINTGADNLGNVTVTRISGSAGQVTIGSISSINRTWIITSNNPPASGRTLTLTWTSDDDNGKMLSNVQAWHSTDGGTNWNSIGDRVDVSQTRTVQFSTNSFGEFTVSDPSVQIKLKVFLQGPYDGSGAMTTTLNSSGLLPLTSETAYPSSTYGYTASTVTSIPNSNIVDWILVELRSGTAASTKAAAYAGFLTNDGSIIDGTGEGPINFSGISAGSYYIVIKHRNHLAIMSAGAVQLGSTDGYDFSTAQTQAYGTNPMVALAGGIYGMIAGDVSRDGSVKYNLGGNDRIMVLNRIGGNNVNASVSGYYNEDVNMNGVVKYNLGGNDRIMIFQSIGGSNVNTVVSTKTPN